jgi:tetratricopeptide (TPR) repeat protein
VQHDGKRVRVNAQLIDTRTNATPWAEHYDRSLEDAFALQSDIAQAIAHQLQARLSPEEKSAIEAPSTTDLQAYDLYLRARSIYQKDLQNWNKLPEAVGLLDEAVERDPKFLRAWCLLVELHASIYNPGNDSSPQRLELAHRALQRAQALAPDAGEVHLAQAKEPAAVKPPCRQLRSKGSSEPGRHPPPVQPALERFVRCRGRLEVARRNGPRAATVRRFYACGCRRRAGSFRRGSSAFARLSALRHVACRHSSTNCSTGGRGSL